MEHTWQGGTLEDFTDVLSRSWHNYMNDYNKKSHVGVHEPYRSPASMPEP